MALNSANFKSNKGRDIKYLSKDFSQFRNSLIEFAKTYFPNTYTDFSDSSIGMMFVEMASYVGDVLSYYVDNTFKETILAYAEETKAVYDIAQSLGYTPKTGTPASVKLDVYATVPSQGVGAAARPNFSYSPIINAGMRVSTAGNTSTFRTTEPVNFAASSLFVLNRFTPSWKKLDFANKKVSEIKRSRTILKNFFIIIYNSRIFVSFQRYVPCFHKNPL